MNEIGVGLKNTFGRNVIVPVSRVKEHLTRGFEIESPGYSSNPDIKNNYLFAFRPFGGWGDIIAIIPAIKQIIKNYESVTLAISQRYHFLFNGLDIHLIDYQSIDNIKDYSKDFRYVLDLWCPARKYEYESNYKIEKGRLENFADSLQVETVKPELDLIPNVYGQWMKNQFPGIPLVGFQIKSAMKSKDWPAHKWERLATKLLADGYQVIVMDEINALQTPGVFNVIRTGTQKIANLIGHLDYMIAVDSGLMWLALAQGVKTLGLFGPTSGEHTIKYFDNCSYIQKEQTSCESPCYYAGSNNYYCIDNEPEIGECMQQITVKEVYESFKGL